VVSPPRRRDHGVLNLERTVIPVPRRWCRPVSSARALKQKYGNTSPIPMTGQGVAAHRLLWPAQEAGRRDRLRRSGGATNAYLHMHYGRDDTQSATVHARLHPIHTAGVEWTPGSSPTPRRCAPWEAPRSRLSQDSISNSGGPADILPRVPLQPPPRVNLQSTGCARTPTTDHAR